MAFYCYDPHDGANVPYSFVAYGWTDQPGNVTATLGGKPGTVIDPGPYYIIAFDNVPLGPATLVVSLGGVPQASRSLVVGSRSLSVSYPMDGAVVARRHLVSYGFSNAPITVCQLQVTGQTAAKPGVLRRDASATKTWIVQFKDSPGSGVTGATVIIVNGNAETQSPSITIDDSFTGV
jgi:hypothetical protein